MATIDPYERKHHVETAYEMFLFFTSWQEYQPSTYPCKPC